MKRDNGLSEKNGSNAYCFQWQNQFCQCSATNDCCKNSVGVDTFSCFCFKQFADNSFDFLLIRHLSKQLPVEYLQANNTTRLFLGCQWYGQAAY